MKMSKKNAAFTLLLAFALVLSAAGCFKSKETKAEATLEPTATPVVETEEPAMMQE